MWNHVDRRSTVWVVTGLLLGALVAGCAPVASGGVTAGAKPRCKPGFTFTPEGNQCIKELRAGPNETCPNGGTYSGLTGTCVIYQRG